MNWIDRQIKGIMLTAGVLTSTMVYAAIAPQSALQSMFGQSINGPVTEIVVRNWGALITLVGVMLIYGAYRPVSRKLILTVAGVSKLIFVTLIVSQGSQFLGRSAGITVLIDSVFVLLFSAHLITLARVPRRSDEHASMSPTV
jgi:hypothetical protein